MSTLLDNDRLFPKVALWIETSTSRVQVLVVSRLYQHYDYQDFNFSIFGRYKMVSHCSFNMQCWTWLAVQTAIQSMQWCINVLKEFQNLLF